jgi:hypothetical protein
MKISILTLLAFFSQISYGQEYKLDSLFNIFQNDIKIELTNHYGRIVWDNDTRENYYLLMEVSPIDTLVKYLYKSNIPAIRCFIFLGLINKNAEEQVLEQIVKNHINDTASFILSPTDLVLTWTVNEYMQTHLKNKSEININYKERILKIREHPRIILHGERHGIITKENLISNDTLIYNINDIKIISFSLTFNRNSEYYELKSDNNILTSEMKKNIKKLNFGDEIYLENIEVLKQQEKRTLSPIKLIVE